MNIEQAKKELEGMLEERRDNPAQFHNIARTHALEIAVWVIQTASEVLPEDTMDTLNRAAEDDDTECDECHKVVPREEYIAGQGLCVTCVEAIN